MPEATTAVYVMPSSGRYTGSGTVHTNGGSLNMRSGPNENYSVIGKIPNGASLVITDVVSNELGQDWLCVEYNGQSGWVSDQWVWSDIQYIG